ncbi:DUF6745 domain-containing protein [Chamaesiphon sp. VAR_69_metabat_338]|uniref:DUF6745 domain-containing protein n=1 Tax=Chamaesiphon sp. VAR_69_metabat_338 TaxID=2964704 RepID=UPI00286E691D|nr:hypothetical protein [Chamaesiphon sp. VAR_69_metabat_338]
MPKKFIITALTPEQELLIPVYREKWVPIAYSMAPLERDREIAAINAAYRLSNYPEPEILFYDNPLQAIRSLARVGERPHDYLGRDLNIKFSKRVLDHLTNIINRQIAFELQVKIANRMRYLDSPYYWNEENPIISSFLFESNCLREQLTIDLDRFNPELEYQHTYKFTHSITRPAAWSVHACVIDFCISVLKLEYDRQRWQAIQQLIQHCGFLMRFERVCIACPRPAKMLFDDNKQLHSDRESALEFPDGYSVYAHHGKHPDYDTYNWRTS